MAAGDAVESAECCCRGIAGLDARPTTRQPTAVKGLEIELEQQNSSRHPLIPNQPPPQDPFHDRDSPFWEDWRQACHKLCDTLVIDHGPCSQRRVAEVPGGAPCLWSASLVCGLPLASPPRQPQLPARCSSVQVRVSPGLAAVRISIIRASPHSHL